MFASSLNRNVQTGSQAIDLFAVPGPPHLNDLSLVSILYPFLPSPRRSHSDNRFHRPSSFSSRTYWYGGVAVRSAQ